MHNQSYGYHIIRVGLAITFLWVGVLILRDPAGWAGYILPWAQKLLPVSPEQMMFGTAVFDIALGGLLLVDMGTWIVSLLAALHLVSVLAVAGIDPVTVRDIGLAAGAVALAVATWPERFRFLR